MKDLRKKLRTFLIALSVLSTTQLIHGGDLEKSAGDVPWIRKLPGEISIQTHAFSGDGMVYVDASFGLWVWDLKTDRHLKLHDYPASRVPTALAIPPGSREMAALFNDNSVWIYRNSRKAKIDCVNLVRGNLPSKRDDLWLVGTPDPHPAMLEPLPLIPKGKHDYEDVSYTADGKVLAVSGEDGIIFQTREDAAPKRWSSLDIRGPGRPRGYESIGTVDELFFPFPRVPLLVANFQPADSNSPNHALINPRTGETIQEFEGAARSNSLGLVLTGPTNHRGGKMLDAYQLFPDGRIQSLGSYESSSRLHHFDLNPMRATIAAAEGNRLLFWMPSVAKVPALPDYTLESVYNKFLEALARTPDEAAKGPQAKNFREIVFNQAIELVKFSSDGKWLFLELGQGNSAGRGSESLAGSREWSRSLILLDADTMEPRLIVRSSNDRSPIKFFDVTPNSKTLFVKNGYSGHLQYVSLENLETLTSPRTVTLDRATP